MSQASDHQETMPELKHLNQLIHSCQSISSTIERSQLFRKGAEPIKSLIAQIYDPFQKFHVTSKSVLKMMKQYVSESEKEVVEKTPHKLSDLLHMLSEGKVSGNLALKICVQFILDNNDYRDTILRALDKDLKIRVGVSIVNKIFPLLVPVFSCALSLPMEKHMKFFEQQRGNWWLSRKLDGCRCMWICKGGRAIAYSRSGHVYPEHIEGLSYFAQKFKDLVGVIDGEMGVVDGEGKEYFNMANSLMNPNARAERSKKNMQMQPNQHLCYFAFDFIPLETFKKGAGGPLWSERQIQLKACLPTDDKHIRILDQHPSSEMDKLWDEAETKGWEGLMLRLDTNYEGKKSRKMLKRKRQDDDEFVIEEATTSMQMPPDSTEMTLALEHVGISYKGCRVWVGSGFSWAQRVNFAKDPQQLVGQHVTVKHYGESRNKAGQYSLRHPCIKNIWGEQGRSH